VVVHLAMSHERESHLNLCQYIFLATRELHPSPLLTWGSEEESFRRWRDLKWAPDNSGHNAEMKSAEMDVQASHTCLQLRRVGSHH
jgi:hypothetical protein